MALRSNRSDDSVQDARRDANLALSLGDDWHFLEKLQAASRGSFKLIPAWKQKHKEVSSNIASDAVPHAGKPGANLARKVACGTRLGLPGANAGIFIVISRPHAWTSWSFYNWCSLSKNSWFDTGWLAHRQVSLPNSYALNLIVTVAYPPLHDCTHISLSQHLPVCKTDE
jgi:hypothetical protein